MLCLHGDHLVCIGSGEGGILPIFSKLFSPSLFLQNGKCLVSGVAIPDAGGKQHSQTLKCSTSMTATDADR